MINIDIRTEEDLNQLEGQLGQFGIGFNRYEARDRMLNKIIDSENVLGIDVRSEDLRRQFDGNFESFRMDMNRHFSGFTADDKLRQSVNKIGLVGTVTYKLTADQKAELAAKGNEYGNWAKIVKLHKNVARFNTNVGNSRWQLAELLKALGSDVELPYFSEFSRLPDTPQAIDSEGNIFTIAGNKNVAVRGPIVARINELYAERYKTAQSVLVEGAGK